eukprot:CAMPEP_0179869134 /NCGR_PEP_ID=MMETSP0982-20121206/19326_1 /TAXON_ID=483367 /ORGANISM="non described non described, Strain CCMP 2436" /LENGTH=287 /DNA_ID=CAMNT_0021759109 /DNA_START=60 /DNA_END=923 /DNA_ORIENTATION=+
MGLAFNELLPKHVEFIAQQRLFFVASAPLDAAMHVNVSPRSGAPTVLSSKTVAYADYAGSGAETAAHVLQNGRMTIMMCNIEEGPPNIMRLYGRATILLPGEVPAEMLGALPESVVNDPGFRCVFLLNIERVQTSCGFSLPILAFVHERITLHEFTAAKGVDGIREYVRHKNAFSIDGLPSLAQLGDGELLRPVAVDGSTFKPVAQTSGTGPLFIFSEPAKNILERVRARFHRFKIERGPGRGSSSGWGGGATASQQLTGSLPFFMGALFGMSAAVAFGAMRRTSAA